MKFPQCEILIPAPAQEILFVSGGRAPSREFFLNVLSGRKIIAVDKGIELCRTCEVVPDLLIGDFDSANLDSVDWARAKNIPVERHPIDKDFTDTQLALSRAAELFGEHIAILTGWSGGRFDHLFSTVLTCAGSRRKIILAEEREIIFYLRGGEKARVEFFTKTLAVSLLPISPICAGVTTKNLHWELEEATLTQSLPNAVSNRVEGDNISVGLSSGTLAVYLCFGE